MHVQGVVEGERWVECLKCILPHHLKKDECRPMLTTVFFISTHISAGMKTMVNAQQKNEVFLQQCCRKAMTGNVAVNPLTDLTFVPFNPTMSSAWPAAWETVSIMPQKSVVKHVGTQQIPFFFLLLPSHHIMESQARFSLLKQVLPAYLVFLPQCPLKWFLLARSLCCADEMEKLESAVEGLWREGER